MRINISIEDELIKKADDYAKKFSYSRSSLIAQSLRMMIFGLNTKSPEGSSTPITSPTDLDNPSLAQIVMKGGEDRTASVTSNGWCELHFEKGVTYPRRLITWEDEYGKPIVEKKLACPKCIAKYEGMGRGRVYYL